MTGRRAAATARGPPCPARPACPPALPAGLARAQAEANPTPAWPLRSAELVELEARRKDELDRGISLVGPHRDELVLTLGNGDLRLPVKGYASHGETWSLALALRMAAYDVLVADDPDPDEPDPDDPD